ISIFLDSPATKKMGFSSLGEYQQCLPFSKKMHARHTSSKPPMRMAPQPNTSQSAPTPMTFAS
ncbi:MAG: hypothetical protein ACO3SO_11760, partial [Luteolibacter sp.]